MRIHFLACSLLATAGFAFAQTPAVNSVTPGAIAPGQTTEITMQGAALNGPTALWTNFQAETSFTTVAEDRAICRVTVPAGAPVGIGALRHSTPGGVSSLQLIMVDDLPTVRSTGDNNSPGAAQQLKYPVAVEGACEPLRFDYYRIKAARGQRVSVEVVAARLGSALDPVLRLLDGSGRELAWADDSAGAGGDCRFGHTFAADGDYLVELRDVNYDGGPGYRYRLRVGDFPLVVAPFPLGARRGGAGMFTLLGEGSEGVAPVMAGLPKGARAASVSGRRVAGGGSGFGTVVAGELDETIEAEPNDSRESATPLPFPAAVSGRFETAGDVDYYKLALRKGQRVSFRGRTRTLGVPCDLMLRLLRKDGSKVAESKVEGPVDSSLDAKAPDDGTYWLQVAEMTGAGGGALAYRIEVDSNRAAFSLSTETDKIDAKPGAEFELKVTCVRKDFGGAVTLSLEGIDPARLDGATIAAGKNETTLKVKLPDGLEAGKIIHFIVAGRAEVDGTEFRTVTSTAPALRKLFPRMLYPPDALDGVIALGVRGGKR